LTPSVINKISIVIPAFNEETRLGATLERTHSYCAERFDDFEIIVVDDGSRDSTAALVEKFAGPKPGVKLLKNGINRGKGFSVRRGILASTHEYALMTDADLSTPIDELEKFLPYAAPDSVVIGSRGLKESNIVRHQPFYREWMGKGFNLLVRLLVHRGIHDTQCGFKLFGPGAKKSVFPLLNVNGFAFDVEILVLAARKGLKIYEVPVVWSNDSQSKVHPLRDSLRMLREIITIRLRHG